MLNDIYFDGGKGIFLLLCLKALREVRDFKVGGRQHSVRDN